MTRLPAAALAALIALPVTLSGPRDTAAQTIDAAPVTACVQAARDSGTAPAACLEQAMTPCQQNSPETPAVGTLCYTEARETWTQATAARLSEIDAAAPEQFAAGVRIETKYDLLSGLLQCDRLEELGHLADIAAAPLLLEKSRCEATASGLAYIRLLWRATQD